MTCLTWGVGGYEHFSLLETPTSPSGPSEGAPPSTVSGFCKYKQHIRKRRNSGRGGSHSSAPNFYLLFLLLLLLLFESLSSLMSSHQLREVGHVLVCLLQQVGQALVFLLVDEFTVALFIFSLRKDSHTQVRTLHLSTNKRLWR